MTVTKRILVGYDGSSYADAALRWAIDTARHEDVPIRVVVVGSPLDMMRANPNGDALMEADERQHTARAILDESPDVESAIDLRVGYPAPEIAHVAGPGDLLVVGSAGHSRTAGILMGSVSQELVRTATCPVVVVRPTLKVEPRIGVGVDGSTDSIDALDWACARAEASGQEVVALHGFNPALHGDVFSGAMHEDLARRIHAEEQQLAQWTAGVRAAHPAVTLTLEAASIPGRDLLTGFSEHAALVVVGAKGHGALTGLVVGSVSQYVLSHAHCPVAVIR